jgi:purine-binding chemotaxis protein CheW
MKNIDERASAKEVENVKEEHQHVTFLIGDETYGVGVEKVKEIIGITDITHVPNTAYFMEGVINLRGTVVPAIDMRKKFKMEPRQFDAYTVIIIVEVMERLIGMIVDSVSDVVSIPISSIQQTPNFTSKIQTEFIDGIGQIDNSLIIILNVDLILSEEEIENLGTIDIDKPAANDSELS